MRFKRVLVLFWALSLFSCGGGGGGGSASPSFSVSTNELNVGTSLNYGTVQPQSISGTVANYSGVLYLYITSTNNGISSITFPVLSGNTGTSSIYMQTKPQGVYFDTVTVQACSDAACTSQLPGSPQVINVTYSVGIAIAPPVLNFSATAGSAPSAQTVTVYYFDPGYSSYNWASSYLYLDGNNWMTYTPSSSGQTPTQVQVTLDAFPIGTSPGIYNAEIHFGANSGMTSVVLPVHYTVN